MMMMIFMSQGSEEASDGGSERLTRPEANPSPAAAAAGGRGGVMKTWWLLSLAFLSKESTQSSESQSLRARA